MGQLLERDPLRRISFEHFFAHPFVDMEHVPGPESLRKAVSRALGCWLWGWGGGASPERPPHHLPQTDLVVEAVKKDQEGDASAALSLYCKALEYFVPALHCESIPGGLCGSRAVLGRGPAPRGRPVCSPPPSSAGSLSMPR